MKTERLENRYLIHLPRNRPLPKSRLMMNGILYVAIGGALGASGRHMIGLWAERSVGAGFPYGTFIVNVFGSLLMGLVIGWLATRQGGDNLKLFLATGFLGGFTTFSAFSLDAINLLERKAYTPFMLYVGGSVFVAILALWIGLMIARKVF